MYISDETRFEVYKDQICNESLKVFVIFTKIISAVSAIPLIISILFDFSYKYILSYGIMFASSIFFKYISQKQNKKKCILKAQYIFYLILSMILIYTSIINVNTISVFYVLFLVVFPIVMLDKTYRLNIFLVTNFIISTVANFCLKPLNVFIDDLINSVLMLVIGVVLGGYLRNVIIEHIIMREELYKISNIDHLTKIYNRRKFNRDLEKLYIQNEDSPFGMMFMDIDNFKQYNDTYGHSEGDKCLVTIAEKIIEFSRERDYKCYRYGGEEFVILCPKKDYGHVSKSAELLVKTISNLNISNNINVVCPVTVSVGYAEKIKCNSTDKYNIIRMADTALYKAKENGKNLAVGYLE